MPSTKPVIAIRLDEKTKRKFERIAENENRKPANLAAYIIKQHISKYEKEHGEIIVGSDEKF